MENEHLNDNPDDIWEADRNLQFNEPLDEDDLRYVQTEEGRGDFNIHRLLKDIGVNPKDLTLKKPPEKQYLLFCGHRGCGKSTEIRRIAKKLNKADLFFVVFLDALQELDINNLQYSDILMALAKKLFTRLEEASIELDTVFLSNLESWFTEKIEKHEKTKDFALDIKAGIEGKAGIPFLGSIFTNISNSFKTNSTYKDELRRIIKDSFSQFADAFNQLILAAENEIERKNQGKKILFIIDGTDKLNEEDSKRFFIHDSYQLKLIESNFIYCAPINLLYESNQVQQMFHHEVLPMIKITQKDSEDPFEKGYEVLRELVYKRVNKSLFDSEDTVNYLIEYSGGCPRELLKLLHYTYLRTESEIFDRDSAEKAVYDLASDYKRILESADYRILYKINNKTNPEENSERIRYLLLNLALMEYNSFWRKSHPVIRLLDGYKIQSIG